MLPLIGYLTHGGWNRGDLTQRADFTFVEGVATRYCLGMDRRKISIDGAARGCMRPKAIQLRMISIAFCPTTQYRSGEECLAPQRNQTFGIKILGMDCPKSHVIGGALRAIKSGNGLELRMPIIDLHPGQLVLHPDVHLRFKSLCSVQGNQGEIDLADAWLMSVGERCAAFPAETAFHLGRGSMHGNLAAQNPEVALVHRPPCHEGTASRPPTAQAMAKAAIPNWTGNREAHVPAETSANIFRLIRHCAERSLPSRRLPELDSTLLPSGSMTHPNFPYSESSAFSSTLQPSSRRT